MRGLYSQDVAAEHRLQCRGTMAGVDLRPHCAGEGPLGTRGDGTTRHARLGDSSLSEVASAKGTDDSLLKAVGTWPARTPTRRSAQREAQGRQADRGRFGGALERGRAVFQPVNVTLTTCFSKKLNCATKTVDTKVVYETSLYNICKGRPMFFSTV
jgi:hypothetical protein